MSKNLLEQLREVTVVVADTGDIQAIEKFKPQDATTNPSLITAAAQMPEYQGIVDQTLLQAKKDAGAGATQAQIVSLAFDRLAVAFRIKDFTNHSRSRVYRSRCSLVLRYRSYPD